MPQYQEMGTYPVGTIILRTSGYRFIKTSNKKWEAEHRVIAKDRLLHRDLLDGERVFHRNGKRDENAPSNLVVIRFNLEKFEKLPHSRIIYIPQPRATSARPYRESRQLVAA